MFKQTVTGLAFLILGYILGMGAVSHSQSMRLELTAGITKHSLASEGSWYYDGFETNNRLITGSYQLGILWTTIRSGAWSYGLRVGYADLGTVTADNKFPIFEYGGPADARVNPVCDRETMYGCTGQFNGWGKTRGWYIGPVVERDFGHDVALGVEAGAFVYKANWIATNIQALDNDGSVFIPQMWADFTWDKAKSTSVTPYLGASARWHYLLFTGRVYADVRASRAHEDPGFVGMTSGPVWSLMFGLSIQL